VDVSDAVDSTSPAPRGRAANPATALRDFLYPLRERQPTDTCRIGCAELRYASRLDDAHVDNIERDLIQRVMHQSSSCRIERFPVQSHAAQVVVARPGEDDLKHVISNGPYRMNSWPHGLASKVRSHCVAKLR